MSELKTVETLDRQPFKYMVSTIGNLPTSFVDSMSYYECIAWLVKYLEKTVIPAVNGNAAALAELQAKFVELKNYVEHYFDNLDVQEEINNKLDDMAEQGELAEIIAQYLQLNGVLAYNTLADLSCATNIIDGSFTRTYGKLTYNDGKGAFYKVRAIKNTDVVDGDNIIALADDTLVAEKMHDFAVDQLQDEVEKLKSLPHIIVIGDSYAHGYTNTGGTVSYVTPYTEYARQFIGYPTAKFHAFGSNGAGFTHLGSGGYTFLTELQTFDESLASVANDVKEIYAFGGINDRDATVAQILTAIGEFVSYAKTKYPNATVYIGELGRYYGSTYALEHSKFQQVVIPAFAQCQQVGAVYIQGTENIMQINSLFSDDGGHPTANGYQVVGKYIGQAILNKRCDVNKETTSITLTSNPNITFTQFDFPLTEKIGDGNITIYSSQVTLKSSTAIAWSTQNVLTLATFDLPYGQVSLGSGISEDVIVSMKDYTTNKSYIIPGKLLFQRDGVLGLYCPLLTDDGTAYVAFTNVKDISMKLQYQTKCVPANTI